MRGVLAYVALGSNLGDRRAMLRAACERIDATRGLRLLRTSQVWETAAVGPPQPDYLNAVAEVEACLTPRAHLAALHRIEAALGRVRDPATRWTARTLDLDLLWQGGLALQRGDLVLPHPRITERSFVLAPLAELAPDLTLEGRTVREWLEARPEEERAGVRRVGPL
ncbi:2-amino-4-hydroxy-6-hydroxymethyldihydropteridine pyrophosphokinase [Vulgatibacter incomptus]|uniref:2-amino-4-hydroxy-6-hydroxymethyldihydropteridine pyrophosphokinase n=2 Tax=Vulgatibacter incomptus TaxID=1391653 RepID=A0A0K1PF90_9BACT|nr:2-amino-4-hydroxy-6-hydroxymethyldihydropteridine pyrophosphokinase [Vulgatibacter incomptus]